MAQCSYMGSTEVLIVEQLLAHLIGDYVLQNHTTAVRKVMSSRYAFLHALMYCLPFLFLTQNVTALAVIGSTHFVIDRYRLARRFKLWYEQLWGSTEPFGSAPEWLTGWLIILIDNTAHLCINAAALRWL